MIAKAMRAKRQGDASTALRIEIEFALDHEGLLTVTSRVEGAPEAGQVVQRLTTQLTTDDALSRLGAERVVPRPAVERMPEPAADPGAASAPKKGFFESVSEGFFSWFKRKKK